MEGWTPFVIYENMVKLCAYRELEVVSRKSAPDVLAQINTSEYATIEAKRGPAVREHIYGPRDGAATVWLILFAPESNYITKTPRLKKLMETLKAPGPTEFILVFHGKLTDRVITAVSSEATRVELHNIARFALEIPLRSEIPRHTIATAAEVKEFCEHYYTSVDKFPKIIANEDPMAIWLGLNVGNVVKIKRVSETAGVAIGYRLCI